MVDIQGVKLPGYGRCIYCGATGSLKDEHIIPFSLGGKAVIEAASCGHCEKITSYLDGYLARQIFHEYRAHTGMKSRRPKERPTELSATIVKPDGTHEVRSFAPKEHPYFLMMPVWNLPGILLGHAPTHNFPIMQAHAYWWIPESMQKTAEMEREQVRAKGTINYTAFARGLARISYCQAVAHLGLDALIVNMSPAMEKFEAGWEKLRRSVLGNLKIVKRKGTNPGFSSTFERVRAADFVPASVDFLDEKSETSFF
jgi:HNH endonuclease